MQLTLKPDAAHIALVTGGSRGLGRAICVALATLGSSVAVNYAGSKQAAEETVALCGSAARAADATRAAEQSFVAVQADVSDAAACEQLYASVKEQLGAPTIVVNNAGVNRDNLAMRMSVEDFDTVIKTNLRPAFILSKLASRAMLKARYGRIINIASVAGITGNAGQANYAASKAGVIGLTKTLARELASRGITANAVAPGFIRSDMTGALSEEIQEGILATVPLGRAGEPQDVANMVAFLASEQAAYITGQVLVVDGGMVM